MQPSPGGLIADLGLQLSIAVLAVLVPRFWLRRMGWVTIGWSVC